MTTDQNSERIQLAEAMGWKRVHKREMVPERRGLYGYLPHMSVAQQIPNPSTDANDCHALIDWLNKKGYWVEIHWQPDKDEFGETMAAGAYVHIWHRDTEQHSRKDFDRERWKECVCDLALKVIEDE